MVDSAPGRGWPASVVTSKITDKVNDLLKVDARMTTHQDILVHIKRINI